MCVSSTTTARELRYMTYMYTSSALDVVALAEWIVAGYAGHTLTIAFPCLRGRHRTHRHTHFCACAFATFRRADSAPSRHRSQRHVQALYNLVANGAQSTHIIDSVAVVASALGARRQHLRATCTRRTGCPMDCRKDTHCKIRCANIRHDRQSTVYALEQAPLRPALHSFSYSARSLRPPCRQGHACTRPCPCRSPSAHHDPITRPSCPVFESCYCTYGGWRQE